MRLDRPVCVPVAYTERNWSPDEALIEILRGRLEGLGPIAENALTAPLGLERQEIAAGLLALEAEGFAMRGRFSPGMAAEEWCERRLLARIHRYTVKRLRAEIEPVAARDFLRFLFGWQRVTPDSQMEGPEAVEAIAGQLEGFEAAAGAWETEILPARVAAYEPAWLDDLCLAGRIAWARLRPAAGRPSGNGRAATPVRTTPIALLPRRHARLWASFSQTEEVVQPSAQAQRVVAYIREQGASFFDELVEGTGLLRPQAEAALAELVALGLANADSFGGLRALLMPSDRRRPSGGRRRRGAVFGMEDAGRWALAQRARAAQSGTQAEAVEHLARILLRRYGVVFWRLLEREAAWLPPWRDLLRVYRRLEARGEIRGGRFVAGFSGEQFALPEAIGMLRETRRKPRFRGVGLGFRRRSTQSRRHPDPRAKARGAYRQPAALPRRRADRIVRRRRGPVSRNPRTRRAMAGPQSPAARRRAAHAGRPVLIGSGPTLGRFQSLLSAVASMCCLGSMRSCSTRTISTNPGSITRK